VRLLRVVWVGGLCKMLPCKNWDIFGGKNSTWEDEVLGNGFRKISWEFCSSALVICASIRVRPTRHIKFTPSSYPNSFVLVFKTGWNQNRECSVVADGHVADLLRPDRGLARRTRYQNGKPLIESI